MMNFNIQQSVCGVRNFGMGMLLCLVIFGTVACSSPSSSSDCPYKRATDLATIVRLIEAEAEAANREDLSIIRAIFAPDAYIRDEEDGSEWSNPIAHYSELFATSEFTNAVNFDIQPAGQGITEDTAWFISSNSGIWTPNGGAPQPYRNVAVKDSWTLRRNEARCWVITEYRYH